MRCPRCKKEGKEDHDCPYAVEINNDTETMCNCCDTCERECWRDI